MQPSGWGTVPTSGWHYRAAEMCPGMGTGQLLPSSFMTTGPVPHVGHGPLSVGMLLEGHPQLDPQPAVMLSAVKQPRCKQGRLLGCCSMLPGFLQGSLSCQELHSRRFSWPRVLHRPTRLVSNLHPWKGDLQGAEEPNTCRALASPSSCSSVAPPGNVVLAHTTFTSTENNHANECQQNSLFWLFWCKC